MRGKLYSLISSGLEGLHHAATRTLYPERVSSPVSVYGLVVTGAATVFQSVSPSSLYWTFQVVSLLEAVQPNVTELAVALFSTSAKLIGSIQLGNSSTRMSSIQTARFAPPVEGISTASILMAMYVPVPLYVLNGITYCW